MLLQVHHILAQQDGGSDDDGNLITLCANCHREWHLAESISTIPFVTWMRLPDYMAMLVFFITPFGADVEAAKAALLSLSLARHSFEQANNGEIPCDSLTYFPIGGTITDT